MHHFPSATVTNSITNAVHAFFLLIYFFLAFSEYRKKRSKIQSIMVVLTFFLLFLNKTLGVVVHYFASFISAETFNFLWMIISFGVLCLDYCLLYSLEIPNWYRRIAFVVAATLSLIFSIRAYFGEVWYEYIALSTGMVFSIAAYYSQGLPRLGFICSVASTVVWIFLREFISFYYIDLHKHVEYKYDNDLYHLMLIVSTYIIYRSVVRGDWSYPKKYKLL